MTLLKLISTTHSLLNKSDYLESIKLDLWTLPFMQNEITLESVALLALFLDPLAISQLNLDPEEQDALAEFKTQFLEALEQNLIHYFSGSLDTDRIFNITPEALRAVLDLFEKNNFSSKQLIRELETFIQAHLRKDPTLKSTTALHKLCGLEYNCGKLLLSDGVRKQIQAAHNVCIQKHKDLIFSLRSVALEDEKRKLFTEKVSETLVYLQLILPQTSELHFKVSLYLSTLAFGAAKLDNPDFDTLSSEDILFRLSMEEIEELHDFAFKVHTQASSTDYGQKVEGLSLSIFKKNGQQPERFPVLTICPDLFFLGPHFDVASSEHSADAHAQKVLKGISAALEAIKSFTLPVFPDVVEKALCADAAEDIEMQAPGLKQPDLAQIAAVADAGKPVIRTSGTAMSFHFSLDTITELNLIEYYIFEGLKFNGQAPKNVKENMYIGIEGLRDALIKLGVKITLNSNSKNEGVNYEIAYTQLPERDFLMLKSAYQSIHFESCTQDSVLHYVLREFGQSKLFKKLQADFETKKAEYSEEIAAQTQKEQDDIQASKRQALSYLNGNTDALPTDLFTKDKKFLGSLKRILKNFFNKEQTLESKERCERYINFYSNFSAHFKSIEIFDAKHIRKNFLSALQKKSEDVLGIYINLLKISQKKTDKPIITQEFYKVFIDVLRAEDDTQIKYFIDVEKKLLELKLIDSKTAEASIEERRSLGDTRLNRVKIYNMERWPDTEVYDYFVEMLGCDVPWSRKGQAAAVLVAVCVLVAPALGLAYAFMSSKNGGSALTENPQMPLTPELRTPAVMNFEQITLENGVVSIEKGHTVTYPIKFKPNMYYEDSVFKNFDIKSIEALEDITEKYEGFIKVRGFPRIWSQKQFKVTFYDGSVYEGKACFPGYGFDASRCKGVFTHANGTVQRGLVDEMNLS